MRVIIAGYLYALENFEGGNEAQSLQFIHKEPGQVEGSLTTISDGTTNEEVLAMLINRMCYLQAKFPCRESAIAITKLDEALLWLNKRTADRKARGVEGQHKS